MFFQSIIGNNRILHIIVCFMYYCLVVLPHEQVGIFTVKVFKSFSRDEYNLIVTSFSILVVLIFSYWIWRRIWKSEDRNLLSIFLIINIILAVLCFKLLFVVNIEVVHFFQYAVFAMLIFPLTKNYTITLLWAMLAGTFDELYQYVILAPDRTNYFDFNDVIINTIGAGFGLIFIRSYRPEVFLFSWEKFKKSLIFKVLIALSIAILIGFLTGKISYDLDPDAWFVFLKKPIPGFWTKVYPQVIFHVIKPLEGLILSILLILFYSKIEKNSPVIDS